MILIKNQIYNYTMSRYRILYLFIISLLFSGFENISSFGLDERMYSQYTLMTEKLDIKRPILSYQYSFRIASDNTADLNVYDNIIPSCSVVSPLGKKTVFGIGYNSSHRVPTLTIQESSYKYILGDYENGIDPIAYNYTYFISGGVSEFYIFLATKLNNFFSTSLKTNILFGNQNNSYQINYYDIEFNGSEYVHQVSGTEIFDNQINFSGYQFDFENKITINNLSMSLMIGYLYNMEISNTSSGKDYDLVPESIHDVIISTRYSLPKENSINLLWLFSNNYFEKKSSAPVSIEIYDAYLFRNGSGNETLFSIYSHNKIMYSNRLVNSLALKYGYLSHGREYHSLVVDANDYDRNRFGYLGFEINYLEQNSVSFDLLLGGSTNGITNAIFNISFSNGLKRLKQIKREE